MESDEDAITVARRKLLLVVPHHCIRRPMGWKDGNGSNLARAYADRFAAVARSEEHTSELQSRGHLVCRLLLEKKKRWPGPEGREARARDGPSGSARSAASRGSGVRIPSAASPEGVRGTKLEVAYHDCCGPSGL